MKISLFFMLLWPIISYAQEKTLSFTNVENPSYFSLADKGFIVDGRETIIRLDAEGNLKWQSKIEIPLGPYRNQVFVFSPGASDLYRVQIADLRNFSKHQPHVVSHINDEGKVSVFQMDFNKTFGKNPQTIFCDADFLYFLFTQDGKEMDNNNKQTEKIVLNRFAKGSFSYSRMIAELPPVPSSENVTFWNYIGQNSEEKFFSSKSIDPRTGKISVVVAALNSEGKLLRTLNLISELNGKSLRPSMRKSSLVLGLGVDLSHALGLGLATNNPFVNMVNLDFKSGVGYSSFELFGSGGFCHISYDEASSAFYAFGLFGPSPYKNIGSVYEGLYLHKFDLSGKLIFAAQQEVPKDLVNSYFRIHAVPENRSIEINRIGEDAINLIMSAGAGNARVFSFSQGGKFLRHFELNMIEDKATHGAKYVVANKLDKEKNTFIKLMKNTKGEILFSTDDKKQTLNVSFFKN